MKILNHPLVKPNIFNIYILRVADRGGRVTEMTPLQNETFAQQEEQRNMPKWSKRQEPPQDQRGGRGGYRGNRGNRGNYRGNNRNNSPASNVH